MPQATPPEPARNEAEDQGDAAGETEAGGGESARERFRRNRDCESAGLVSVKSRFPSRTSSMNFVRLGAITTWIAPYTVKYTPSSATSWGGFQPASVSVRAKTRRTAKSAEAMFSADSKICTQKF